MLMTHKSITKLSPFWYQNLKIIFKNVIFLKFTHAPQNFWVACAAYLAMPRVLRNTPARATAWGGNQPCYSPPRRSRPHHPRPCRNQPYHSLSLHDWLQHTSSCGNGTPSHGHSPCSVAINPASSLLTNSPHCLTTDYCPLRCRLLCMRTHVANYKFCHQNSAINFN